MSRKKQSSTWVFTLNNYTTEEFIKIKEKLELDTVKRAQFQEEVSDTGTPHLQGYIQFINKRTMLGIKRYLGINRIHLEPCKSKQASIKYTSKLKSRKPGTVPYTFGVPIKEGGTNRPILDEVILNFISGKLEPREFRKLYPRYWLQCKQRLIEEKVEYAMTEGLDKRKKKTLSMKLYPWQQQVINKFTTQSYGKVLWIWDHAGQIGKSVLADYIMFTIQDVYFVDGGSWKDILYSYGGQTNVIYDYSRAQIVEEIISYVSMEKLLNGRSSSSKYRSKVLLFGYNKLLVFANYPPKWHMLSKKRWLVYEVRGSTNQTRSLYPTKYGQTLTPETDPETRRHLDT